MAKIAVLGYGVVGSGVLEVLNTNKESIRKRALEEIEVKYILDIRDFKDDPYSHLITKNFDDILNDEEVSVVVEVMGGLNPAYEYTKRLLLKGKHVVTSNKELVASFGAELLKIAKDNEVNYLFEASVGGGIPIIRPLNCCLTANEINSIKGILNGTTNYILTKMFKENMDFSKALSDAQRKGYAEKNPAADIEGHDACRKIAILASLVFGKRIDYKRIKTEGITNITLTDVEYADKLSSVIKLIGSAKIESDRVYASVEPSIIKNTHPLSGIDNVFNGILVTGNAIGDVMFYGKGAGKLPTASAVVADVIDSVRNTDKNNGFYWEDADIDFVMPYEEASASFLIRISGDYSDLKDKIKDIISDIIKIKSGEFAVISKEEKISTLEEKLSDLPVIKKIRICE